jgi:hypothetical protein
MPDDSMTPAIAAALNALDIPFNMVLTFLYVRISFTAQCDCGAA